MTDAKDNDRKPTKTPRDRSRPNRRAKDWTARANKAIRELESLGRSVLRHVQKSTPEAALDTIQLPLRLSLGEPERGASAAFVRALEEEIRESLLASAAFSRGRVYCLRCENSICEHSVPPGPRHVFRGYGQTGRAEWVDFGQLMAQRGDPRRGLLYEEPAPLLTIAMSREDVYHHLLPGFDESKRRFLILAQLVISPFPLNSRKDSEDVALTIQLIQTQQSSNQNILGTNVIGWCSDSRSRIEELSLPSVEECLHPIRRELDAVSRKGKGRSPVVGIALERLSQRCLTLVRTACKDLEHRHRAAGRRTRHAQQRSQQADRPTSKALEDAKSVQDENLLQDTMKNTVVVLGQRGRVHFFAENGKHVTSIVFEGRVIRQRMNKKRWVPLPKERIRKFRRDVLQPSS